MNHNLNIQRSCCPRHHTVQCQLASAPTHGRCILQQTTCSVELFPHRHVPRQIPPCSFCLQPLHPSLGPPARLLSHHVSSTSRNFPSHLGTSTPSTRGPSHAANSSSITLSRDPSLPTSSFSKKSLPTSDARVHSDFWVTDAEDDASFSSVSFTTMALLSHKCFASGPDPQLGGEGVEEGGKLTLESVFRMKVREGCALRGPCQPS